MNKLLTIGFMLFSICADAQVYNGILSNYIAGENITAPKWVYFTAGEMELATNTEATQAAGLVLQTVASPNIGQAYVAGFVSSWPGGGLTRGPYYLSTSTAGAMTSTRPSPAYQRVGYAVSDTSFIISIEGRTLAMGYGGGTTEAVSVDDAGDKVSLKSEDGINYFDVGNSGIGMYTQNESVSIDAGSNLTMSGSQNVVIDAINGGMDISSETGLNITSQTSDVSVTGNRVFLDADSIQVALIPDNFTGERTFVTQSPGGYLTKQEGISPEDLTHNAWPVGSVFISIVSTNPNTLLGYGTWSAFGTGRVLVGIDAGQTEFDTVEETGGAKTHTLTEAEMPAHTHTYQEPAAPTPVIPSGFGEVDAIIARSAQNTGSTGGGAAHNNLQPYIVVHMWLRTN